MAEVKISEAELLAAVEALKGVSREQQEATCLELECRPSALVGQNELIA